MKRTWCAVLAVVIWSGVVMAGGLNVKSQPSKSDQVESTDSDPKELSVIKKAYQAKVETAKKDYLAALEKLKTDYERKKDSKGAEAVAAEIAAAKGETPQEGGKDVALDAKVDLSALGDEIKILKWEYLGNNTDKIGKDCAKSDGNKELRYTLSMVFPQKTTVQTINVICDKSVYASSSRKDLWFVGVEDAKKKFINSKHRDSLGEFEGAVTWTVYVHGGADAVNPKNSHIELIANQERYEADCGGKK